MHAAMQLDSTCGPVHKNETGMYADLIFCAPDGAHSNGQICQTNVSL